MKTLYFSHRYDKLKDIESGDKAICSHVERKRMKDIPLDVLMKDTKPLCKDMNEIMELFRSFGYRSFNEDTYMSIYTFVVVKDKRVYKFTTIRKPEKFRVGEEVDIQIQQKNIK